MVSVSRWRVNCGMSSWWCIGGASLVNSCLGGVSVMSSCRPGMSQCFLPGCVSAAFGRACLCNAASVRNFDGVATCCNGNSVVPRHCFGCLSFACQSLGEAPNTNHITTSKGSGIEHHIKTTTANLIPSK